MKVAYIFSTSGHTVDYKLGQMILPQLESGQHGAEVVGMFFFDDNTFVLRQGDPTGERLSKVAQRWWDAFQIYTRHCRRIYPIK